MKKLILIAALAVAITAHADNCAEVEKYAARIIDDFQRGVTGQQAWETTRGVEWLEMVVLNAYEQPRYGVELYDKRQKVAFISDWFIQCKRAGKGNE